MRGVNRVMLIGNLGKDPDVQQLEGNIAVAKFPLAKLVATSLAPVVAARNSNIAAATNRPHRGLAVRPIWVRNCARRLPVRISARLPMLRRLPSVSRSGTTGPRIWTSTVCRRSRCSAFYTTLLSRHHWCALSSVWKSRPLPPS